MDAGLLVQFPLFRHLRVEQLETLAKHAKDTCKGRGDPIFLAGERMIGIYVVTEGAVGIYPKDHKQPVAMLRRGEALGETVLIQDHLATVSVRAEEDNTRLLFLPKRGFDDFLKADISLSAGLYLGICEMLTARLRAANSRMMDSPIRRFAEVKALPSAEDILQKAEQTLSTGRDSERVDASLSVGVMQALESLIDRVPANVAAELRSIAYDVGRLREREQATFAAFSRHITEVNSMLKSLMVELRAAG